MIHSELISVDNQLLFVAKTMNSALLYSKTSILLGRNCNHYLLRQFLLLFSVGWNYSQKKTPLGTTPCCYNRLTSYTLLPFGKKIIAEVLL